ncbi:MAG: 50S ribosomal protein L10 [Candidatus Taylorbacteria bacterium RIFCSPHIGHO2_01_FULL_45_63]|nr:MAG: 50S ribosomal protein L10 [Candidatus Taylorbacteria bacterium RIFCSPHIGHO2_01_FULL_45_63]OHA33584.1 MAG: 50S ribosomal protein L10 [Candidatus Taylorbacteria bacterium RIFCSPLOWO2_01_FULL_45_34b]
MPLTKQKKKEILENVSTITKDFGSVVMLSYSGLTVAEVSAMRRKMRESEVGYRVAKKSIVKKVLEGVNIPGEVPALSGQVAFAYGQDPIAPAREVFEAGKKYDGKITILGGIFEKHYIDKDFTTMLATIPPLQTLYAQFVNLINSPIQGLVLALDAVAKKKL